MVNSRQGGCPNCAQYIGRVFIDDVYSSGSAKDGDYPLLSEAISGGLFHPRCKDSTSTYYEGITTLKPATEDEIDDMKRQEALEQQKSYCENQAEKCGRISEYSLDSDNKRAYAKRAEVWQEKADEVSEKLDKSVANSEKSVIMRLKGEGMYRKSSAGKIEPMPKKQFHRIEKRFKRLGGIFQYDEATDKYLESKHAEAITYNEKTILFKSNPGRASVFEELIHSYQYKIGKNDGTYLSRLNCEIEAQKKLLKYSKFYKLTKIEIEQTKSALKAYETELNAYVKKGGN